MRWCLIAMFLCTACVHWPGVDVKPVKEIAPPTALRLESPKAQSQPDKVLKPTKINLAWTTSVPTNNLRGYIFYQGPASSTYTQAMFTTSTQAVATVYPGKTYWFFVKGITTITNNGVALTLDGQNPKELSYTVPKQGGGPK